ncbi:MAG: M48 family metallopeptidase [Bacteroidota bacterium]
MYRTTAIYFDGNSSTAQTIDLLLDTQNALLVFASDTLSIQKWPVEDIILNHVSGLHTIQYGSSPIQTIKIEDQAFIHQLNQYRKAIGKDSWYQGLLNLGFIAHISIALALFALLVVSYIWVLPAVAEHAVVLVPESYDITVGEEFYEQFMEYNEIDSFRTESLNQFAKKLQLHNQKPLQFTVVKSETVNAFALPDGHIVVFTGLIELMDNYDELVALIGHEATHVNERHSVKMLCRNVSGYLIVSAILSDANGIMATLADNANGLYSLSFSRGFEREADLKGFDIMESNRVNPYGMTHLFDKLVTGNDTTIIVPEFLSSHPVTKDRMSYMHKTIESRPYSYKSNLLLKKLFDDIKRGEAIPIK